MSRQLYLFVYLFALLVSIKAQTVKHHEFCIPPVWNATAEADEIVTYEDGTTVHLTSIVYYYLDYPGQLFRGDYRSAGSDIIVTAIQDFNQLLEFIIYSGTCDVYKIDPEVTFSNCFEVEDNERSFYLGGSISVIDYTFQIDNGTFNLVVSRGSYIPIFERERLSIDGADILGLISFFNVDTAPHFGEGLFVPPDYCQVVSTQSRRKSPHGRFKFSHIKSAK